MARKKKPSKALASASSWKNELAKYATDDIAREPAGTGTQISVRGGKFQYQGAVLEAPMHVVILDDVFENAWYDSPFDPDNPTPPACYAVNSVREDIAPAEDSPKPQADTCAECEFNKFGSAERGKGKACRNGRKAAIISADEIGDVEEIQKSEPAFIKISPTGLRLFAGYKKKIQKTLKLPLFAVVTEMDFDEEEDYPLIVPKFHKEISDRNIVQALIEKRNECSDELLAGFDTTNYVEPSPRSSRRKSVAAKTKSRSRVSTPQRSSKKTTKKTKGKKKRSRF